MTKYYVTMTDKFMSGWGGAKNRIAKYVLVCKDREEAEVVAANVRHRPEMKDISIVTARPKYDSKKYQVTFADKKKAKNWYVPGYFAKKK